jgi:phosphonate transport system substrate-binding protein
MLNTSRFRVVFLIALGLVVGLMLANTLADVARQSPTEPLTLAVIPSDDPGTTKADWEPVIEYLEAGLGRQIELHIVPDYTAVVEAMKYGWVDVARMSAKGYVQAIEEGAKVEAVAKAIRASTGQPGYYGYIVARADRKIADLNGVSFAFVDVGSTSGYVVPSVHLEKEGMKLGEVFMAGSHPAVILAVKNGMVDAGATANSRFDAALAEGVIVEGELEILWQSPLIPNPPIVVQSSMNEALKEQVTRLFLDMPQELVESIKGLKEIGYVEATDSDYDPIREIERFGK